MQAFEIAAARMAQANFDPMARHEALLAVDHLFERVSFLGADARGDVLQRAATFLSADWAEEYRQYALRLAEGAGSDSNQRPRIGPRDPTPALETTDVVCLLELRCDAARLRLLRGNSSRPPGVAWTTSWLDYPAFREAIPFDLRPDATASLSQHLLLIAHEVTHVLSLRGAVGFALGALRNARFRVELELWRRNGPANPEEMLQAFRAADGVAPLRPGAVSLLTHVEIACAAVLKASSLQTVWRPFLEGVAVLAESCVDPVADPAVIDDVFQCVRNLFDFRSETEDIDERRAQYLAFIGECERAISVVVQRDGLENLRKYLTENAVTYFCGYLVVRALLSRLRATAERPLTPSQALRVLLHALRHGAFDAIPDPSLPPNEYYDDALRRMCAFVRMIGGLSKNSLDAFLEHSDPRTSPGKFGWEGGQIVKVDDDLETHKKYEERLNSWREWHYTRALIPDVKAPAAPSDARDGIGDGDWVRYARALEARRKVTELFNDPDWIDDARRAFAIHERDSALLPIGEARGRFRLDVTQDGGGRLHLLTPAAPLNLDDAGAMFISHSFPLTAPDVDRIREHHRTAANPHMQVARVAICDERYFGLSKCFYVNVLFIGYGAFRTIIPCDDVGEAVFDEADGQSLVELARAIAVRFSPGVASIERGAPPDELMRARAILDWIERSDEWSLGEYRPKMSNWRGEVKALAKEVLDAREQGESGANAAFVRCALLSAVFGDCEGIAGVAARGFRAAASERRNALAEAIYLTATAPIDAVPDGADHFVLGGRSLFERGPYGFDLRPMSPTEQPS